MQSLRESELGFLGLKDDRIILRILIQYGKTVCDMIVMEWNILKSFNSKNPNNEISGTDA